MYVCPIYPSVNTVCIHLTFYINLEKSKTSKLFILSTLTFYESFCKVWLFNSLHNVKFVIDRF